MFIVNVISRSVFYIGLTLSCLPIYPMPSLKVFYQNMDYYNELNINTSKIVTQLVFIRL